MRMNIADSRKLSHKEWRCIAKKERRRRLRRKIAQERDAVEERLRAALESSAEYLNLVEEQEKLEAQEQEEHAKRERLWLEEEVRAQKEWEVLQEEKAKAREQYLEQQMKLRKELEEKQEAIQKKKEEERRRHEEQLKRQEQLQKEIDDYIDNGMKTPEALREVVDTQPTKKLCTFFTKTGACRYGDACSKNHRRIFLSKVILISGFYSHFSLEKNSAEYDTDIALEFENSETQDHFYEFYKDVISELKSFGKIKTLRCCRNTEIHLRGNLYIEYYTEREAARAWRKLKGRWYAGKQLNCEFTNLKSWRSAICGMTNCPKGRACNFLHVFRNPHHEYDIQSPFRQRTKDTPQEWDGSKRSEHKSRSRWEEPFRDDNEESRNWRWSESPEMELLHYTKNNDKKRSYSIERDRSRKSSCDKRYHQSERSSERSSRSTSSSEKYHRSRRNKNYDNGAQDDETMLDKHSSKRHRKESKKRSRRKSP